MFKPKAPVATIGILCVNQNNESHMQTRFSPISWVHLFYIEMRQQPGLSGNFVSFDWATVRFKAHDKRLFA
jgi:hypothetical protein